MNEKISKKIKIIAISASVVGVGLLGSHLISEQSKKDAEIKMADKYDLSQIANGEKLDISYGNNEAYFLIDAYDKKLKKLDKLEFTDVDIHDYKKSVVFKMNNYIRHNSEKPKKVK